MAIKRILVVEPLHILRFGVPSRKNAKGQGLILGPGKMFMALLQQLDWDSGQRGQDKYDPFVRGRHIMHHTRIGDLEPAFLEFLAILIKQEIGNVCRGITLCLVSKCDKLASMGVDFGVSSECRRRVLAVEIVRPLRNVSLLFFLLLFFFFIIINYGTDG